MIAAVWTSTATNNREQVEVPALAPWRASLLTVPRHHLIPDTVWVDDHVDRRRRSSRCTASSTRIGGSAGQRRRGVPTQVDDGHPGRTRPRRLDAHEGHRVCEIGTGTGYHAALPAHRLGADQFTTIDVDPDIATRANETLSDTGFDAVTVVTGDGALGYPPGARTTG